MNWDAANFFVGLISLCVALVTSLLVGYMTFVMMQFSAKPKLSVHLIEPTDEYFYAERGSKITFRALLQNVGHWYVKPKATNTNVYWNFDPSFELICMRFGANLDFLKSESRPGKGGSKYLKASGIHLSIGEQGESIEVEALAPASRGRYHHWISISCDEGFSAVYDFWLAVK